MRFSRRKDSTTVSANDEPSTAARSEDVPSMLERSTARFEAGRSVAPLPDSPEDTAVLQAVVIPLTGTQVGEAVTNFDRWAADLTPLTAGEAPFADLVVVLNNGDPAAARGRIADHAVVQSSFRAVHVLTAELHGADDAYRIGDATGANNLFFFTLGAMRNYSVFLLMETDVQPMRAGWLSDAAVCVATQMGTKWVLGAQYRGDGPMADTFWRHVNGNAFYRSGSPEFEDFYLNEFLPFYGEQYDDHDFRFGYDAAHELFLGAFEDRARARVLLSKFGHTDFIVNLRSHDDDSAVPRGRGFEGVLWHRGGWMKRSTS